MKALILGSTGMLGHALMNEARSRGLDAIGLARTGADRCADITDDAALHRIIGETRPDAVINTVALVSLDECEKDPARAYLVNARPASVLAGLCVNNGIYYVHISTDHYYSGDGNKKHDERHPVELVNEYARTKFAAECFTLLHPGALVLRTNIVGFRAVRRAQPTFVEWAFSALEEDAPMTMFRDFYTSSIDVRQFSRILFDLTAGKPSGVMNVASRDVRSKQNFIEALARRMGRKPTQCSAGSITELRGARRAASLGLDVAKAEQLLGYALPSFDQVIDSLMNEYNVRKGS